VLFRAEMHRLILPAFSSIRRVPTHIDLVRTGVRTACNQCENERTIFHVVQGVEPKIQRYIVGKNAARSLGPNSPGQITGQVQSTIAPGALSEQQIWQLVAFLSHVHDLPPAAKQVFLDDGGAKADTPGSK
jgi:hypothetical protein